MGTSSNHSHMHDVIIPSEFCKGDYDLRSDTRAGIAPIFLDERINRRGGRRAHWIAIFRGSDT